MHVTYLEEGGNCPPEIALVEADTYLEGAQALMRCYEENPGLSLAVWTNAYKLAQPAVKDVVTKLKQDIPSDHFVYPDTEILSSIFGYRRTGNVANNLKNHFSSLEGRSRCIIDESALEVWRQDTACLIDAFIQASNPRSLTIATAFERVRERSENHRDAKNTKGLRVFRPLTEPATYFGIEGGEEILNKLNGSRKPEDIATMVSFLRTMKAFNVALMREGANRSLHTAPFALTAEDERQHRGLEILKIWLDKDFSP